MLLQSYAVAVKLPQCILCIMLYCCCYCCQKSECCFNL